MQANNIGWAWWPHKKIDAIAGPLSARLLPNYQVLLDYWNGQGSQPTVEFATNALIQQAQALSITQTDFHSGVIDALIRQPGNTNTIPFVENQIPGVIYGAHYDLGKRGFAYEDSDYQNVGGGSWNNGWIYRNDGVDIEECNDAFTLGYNVGWIEHGEWLKHKVTVQQSGTFNLNLRVSAPNSGGKILLKWDGSNLTDIIDLPTTGGWQNWETVSISNIQLTSGTHTLQVRFLFGGFNYNYIEFVQTAVNVEDEEQPVKDFKVMQNYPNPFNPNTNIEYIVPSRGRLVMKLYDTLGNEIALLQDVELDEGKYTYNLDAKEFNLSSGNYFYQVVFNGERTVTKKATLIK
jgi:endoglucanase